jgi:hypothetical protein
MTEPNLDELRQKIYDVLNVHTPAGCAGRHCWGVEALEKLISDQVAKARIDELNTIDDGLYDVGASKGEWGIPTKWSKDNYADLWTPNNAIHEYIQGCIAELSNKDSK